jgi:hypothetical protein
MTFQCVYFNSNHFFVDAVQLVTHYKDMVAEREKLKTTLSQSQDRAFRRMSELREQIQLDQLAKRDLEDNYRLMLEERDEFNKVLQMQVLHHPLGLGGGHVQSNL